VAKTIHQETLQHRDAFNYYYSLGSGRSANEVGKKFGVTGNSVYNWALSFDWERRIRERDKELGDKLDAQSKASILEQRAKIAAGIKALIDRAFIPMPDGTLFPTFHIESAQDFERVARMFQLITGEPTDRSAVDVSDSTARDVILSRVDRLSRLSADPSSN
jgi:hypothetical protein